MSIMSSIRPEHICSFLKYENNWQAQRDRAGAVLAEGFSYWDKFQKVRPFLFAFSAAGSLFGGYMWWKRGLSRKSKARNIEINILYPVATATLGAIAWITRPGGYLDPARYVEVPPEAIPPEPGQPAAPAPSQQTPQQVAMQNPFMGWVDGKVVQFRQRDPRFADKAIRRLLGAPGIRAAWAEVPPQAQVLLECGRG